jgi:hypothetical protein
MDPPAEMEQYSKRPSKTGQSSPTLTIMVYGDEERRRRSREWKGEAGEEREE